MNYYCTFCHRECEELDDDTAMEDTPLSNCHAAPTLEGSDKWIVMAIRRMWAADSTIPNRGIPLNMAGYNPDYPFGTGNEDPVQADLELLDAFKTERQHHDDDLHTIWVLIRG